MEKFILMVKEMAGIEGTILVHNDALKKVSPYFAQAHPRHFINFCDKNGIIADWDGGLRAYWCRRLVI